MALRTLFMSFVMAAGLSAKAVETISISSSKNPALLFLASLNANQKAQIQFPVNSSVRSEWRYFPEPTAIGSIFQPKRSGLKLNQLNPEQQTLLMNWVFSELSEIGQNHVKATLHAEKDTSHELRGLINSILFKYGPEHYYVSLFGSPLDQEWGWRFEGHHISFNFSVSNGVVTVNPIFIGANPAHVVLDDGTDVQSLGAVQKSMEALVGSLSSHQKLSAQAQMKKVPKFNMYGPGLLDKTLKFKKPAPGLPYALLSLDQQREVINLIENYQAHFLSDAAQANVDVALSDLDSLEVVWFGHPQLKEPFYFRLQSSKFVLEIMSSEDKVDHFHTAWINL